MGNTQLKQNSPKPTDSATSQVRRSQSLAVPAVSRQRAPETSGQPHRSSIPAGVAYSMKRRPSKSFYSSVNISSNGQVENGQATSTHPAPEKYRMTTAQRDMIRSNWDANRDRRFDIARRIYGRAFNKRPDIREIYEHIGPEVWADEATKFGDFLDGVIQNVDDLSAIERLSLDLGRRHGDWRQQGFKPEFWVALAESMTKECCYLDLAVHPAGEVLDAWSKLVGLVFGWARDGYYEQVRLQRRMSRKIVTKSASTSSRSLSSGSRSDSTDEPITTTAASINGNTLPSIEAVGTPPSDSVTLT